MEHEEHLIDVTEVWEELAKPGGRIVFVVMDGAGGLPHPESRKSAFEWARCPNLDRLAEVSSCGLLEMVGPGITPGSGPGHLALFGYNPLRYTIGRGILSALGVGFDLKAGDVGVRVNFATMDGEGRLVDRRAGRIPTEINAELCDRVLKNVRLDFDGEYFLIPEKEHRAALILRGSDLYDDIPDTDPQVTGVAAREAIAKAPRAEKSAALIRSFLEQVNKTLAGEPKANTMLLRGIARYAPPPGLQQRFGLKGLCIAQYPMYRGVSRLLGMDIAEPEPGSLGQEVDLLVDRFDDGHDFFFVHVKGTDSAGEDGDFNRKVSAIEETDALLPRVLALNPDVLVITCDHSTPTVMKSHSWHPVPVLLHSRYVRPDPVRHFDEYHCLQGALGLRPGVHLMGLALANAGRLQKFGA